MSRAVVVDEPARTLAFSLTLLANAAEAPKPLTSCHRGRLRVAGRSWWQPISYAPDLTALLHEAVDCDA